MHLRGVTRPRSRFLGKVLGRPSRLEFRWLSTGKERRRRIACRPPVNNRGLSASTNKSAAQQTRSKVIDNEPRFQGLTVGRRRRRWRRSRRVISVIPHVPLAIGRENNRSARSDRAIMRHNLHRVCYSLLVSHVAFAECNLTSTPPSRSSGHCGIYRLIG